MTDPIVAAVVTENAEVRGWFRKLVATNPVTSVVAGAAFGAAVDVLLSILI